MKRFLPYIFILVIMVGGFLPVKNIKAQTAPVDPDPIGVCRGPEPTAMPDLVKRSACPPPNRWQPQADAPTQQQLDYTGPDATSAASTDPGVCSGFTNWTVGGCIAAILSKLAFVLMKIASLIVGIAGLILNTTIYVTIMKMSDGINSITGINTAWKIIRDLMNIVFIFMLVYKGIMLIINQENRENIQNFIFSIVLASLLVNFSLFFTKVIIDSSNIVTVGIYNTIIGDEEISTWSAYKGLSNRMMTSMGIQTFWSFESINLGVGSNDSDNYAHLASNLLGTVLFLVTAFAFLAASAMLLVRYLILIFLLTLSPVAYMGSALPGVKSYADSWWKSLWGQVIFAPLFMAMMLITLTLISGGLTKNALSSSTDINAVSNIEVSNSGISSTVNVLFNFSLIIGLMLASIVVAKKYSSQGHEYVGNVSKWATGKVAEYGGRAVFGSAGAISRNTVGAVASRAAQSQAFQNAAANNWFAEKALRATRRTADSSFDVRATAAGSSLAGVVGGLGKAQTGGFNQTLKDRTTEKQKFADSLTSSAAKRTYASRIAGGVGVIGGSRPGHIPTVLGTMGRSDRVVASKIIFDQLDPLRTQLTTLQTTSRDQNDVLTQLNQDMTNMELEYAQLDGLGAPVAAVPPVVNAAGVITTPGTPASGRDKQEERRYQQLRASNNTTGSLANIRQKIVAQQNRITGTNNQIAVIQPHVTNLTNEAQRLGISSLTQQQEAENEADRAAFMPERHTDNTKELTPQQEAENAADRAAGRRARNERRANRAHEQNY